jgi:ATP-binding cassette subfamily B protein
VSEQKRGSDWRLFGKLTPYLAPHAWLFVVALVAAPLGAVLTVLQPWLLKTAIDEEINRGDIVGTQQMALAYLGVVIVGWLLEATYLLAMSYGAIRSITDLRDAVYGHTLSRARRFFDNVPSGRLLTRVTSDVEALGETLTAGALTIVLDVLRVSMVLVAMFWLDWRLTLVMLTIGPVVALVVDRIRRVLRRLYQEVRTSVADLNAYTAERLQGLQVVQLYSDEQRAMTDYMKRVDRYRNATIQTNVWDASLYAIIDGLSAMTMALMLWYGSGGLLEGVVTAGLLAAFIDYVSKLYRPIQEFSAKLAVIQRAMSALEKIFGLLDNAEEIDLGEAVLPSPNGAITLRDVHFAYGDGPDVLRGVDLEINPGEVVALVGRTGSGKTTLGRLLTRAYEGYRGSIRLDGKELDTLELSSVRAAVSSVMQDVQLFPSDVRFNLGLGQALTDEELWEVIDLAHARDAVEALGGLDGAVEQAGANLSVGEAQLLSFARTMAYDAPVVILDEATANVDTLTEVKIQAATDALLSRKTVLVIAHRLSTITNADRIALMDAGRVTETGTHVDLMVAKGEYSKLVLQQFESAPTSASNAVESAHRP